MNQADERQATGEVERSTAEDSGRVHLTGVADGCGCAEVWEYRSESRGD